MFFFFKKEMTDFLEMSARSHYNFSLVFDTEVIFQ
jgi:hypothetical protein